MAPRTQLRKSSPTPGDVHINGPLTNISVGYAQSQDVFVADKVFPVVPVQKQSDLYYLYDKEDFFRDEARPRAPATESAGGGFDITTDSYNCVVEAYHKDIDDQMRANADSQLQIDTAGTLYVTQKMLIRRERRWVANFFGTGIWGTDMVGVASASPSAGQFTQWDFTGADPSTDIDAGKAVMAGNIGKVPTTLTVTYPVFLKLRRNAAIRDQFKYTSAASINAEMMARYFDVDNFIIMKAVYTSTRKGAATQTTGFIGGKNALLSYSPPSPSLFEPSAGYTFAWTGFVGGINGYRIKRIRADLIGADRVEGEMAYDMKRVASSCGYFFSGVIA